MSGYWGTYPDITITWYKRDHTRERYARLLTSARVMRVTGQSVAATYTRDELARLVKGLRAAEIERPTFRELLRAA